MDKRAALLRAHQMNIDRYQSLLKPNYARLSQTSSKGGFPKSGLRWRCWIS